MVTETKGLVHIRLQYFSNPSCCTHFSEGLKAFGLISPYNPNSATTEIYYYLYYIYYLRLFAQQNQNF